jgi:hypothetical protein
MGYASTINTVTNQTGFTYTGVIGKSNVSGNDLTSSFVLVTFDSGATSASCTFINNLCTSANNFSIDITPGNSQTNSATWTITNLRSGAVLSSVNINVIISSPKAVAFDGGSIHGVTAGTTAAVADAFLTDAVHTTGQTPNQATEYARLILTFSNNFTSTAGVNTFGFGAGNHFLDSYVADVPEPGTYGMVGLALAGLGALKFRRRKKV